MNIQFYNILIWNFKQKFIFFSLIYISHSFISFYFSFYLAFKNKGKYKIKYIFKNLVKSTNYMFYQCSSLISLDLSNFNTQNVTNMNSMFCYCESLI